MSKTLVSMFVLLSLFSCQKKHAQEAVGSSTDAQAAPVNVSQTKVQQIKSLYLALATQLQSSSDPNAQSLAQMSTAIGNMPDDQVQDYVQSGHAQAVSSQVTTQQNAGQSVPVLISNRSTQIAAITMISLGAVAIASPYITKRIGGTYRPMLGGHYATFAVGIAAVIIGGELLVSPNSSSTVNKAENLTLAAGIIAMVLGTANIAMTFVTNSMVKAYLNSSYRVPSQIANLFTTDRISALREKGSINLAEFMEAVRVKNLGAVGAAAPAPEPNASGVVVKAPVVGDVEKASTQEGETGAKESAPAEENFKDSGNMVWAAATVLLGAGLVAASQIGFNLANDTQSPSQILAQINNLLASQYSDS